MSIEAFANGGALVAALISIGEVGARTATIGDDSTAAGFITICQATPGVTRCTVTAAVADECPALDKNVTLDTRVKLWS